MIVIDPRFTRTAAHADHFLRIRPGTDVPIIWGMMYHIFKNGWEDKEYIRQRVYGMDDVKAEVAKWTPDEVERVTGVPENQVYAAAKAMADNRPGTFIWCMGGTQHTIGNNNTRAYCAFQLALGNIGVSGGGANIFRGHDNVQGATDLGVLADTLPGYYGLAPGSWGHWARVWELDPDWIKGRFDNVAYDKDGTEYIGEYDEKDKAQPVMNTKGIPVSRWIDGVLEDKENIAQRDNVRAMFMWGHAPNSQTRGPEMKKAMEKLDLLVVVDPYPTVSAVMHDRTDGVYLLPASTQFETYGSVTASNRSLQWRDKVIEPLFESLPDHTIMYKLAKKLGFEEQLFKNIKVNGEEPLIEDITREFNRGMWTIGYTGQSPERMKLHQQNWGTFDYTSLKAEGGPADGDFYGMPWPSWGTPEMKHPGTPNLYDTSSLGRRGRPDLPRPLRRRTQRRQPAGRQQLLGRLRDQGWLPGIHGRTCSRNSAGGTTSPPRKKRQAEGKNWKTDLSGGIQRVAIKHGCAPFGNAKARAQSSGPSRTRSRSIASRFIPSRRDLVEKYPTYEDRKSFWRLPTRYGSIQAKDYSTEFPIILTSGRLVEYEGGGDETRSNPWLAELQQDMFVEIHPRDANDAGIKDGQDVWIESTEGAKIKVKSLVTRRVALGRGLYAVPFWRPFRGQGPSRQISRRRRPLCAGRGLQHRVHLRLRLGDTDAGNQMHPLSHLSRLEEDSDMANMKFYCDAERCIECNACVTACKNENEVPWGVNRRRVVTIKDGEPGERSLSVACMHCADAPCAAVCPVDCFYTTEDGRGPARQGYLHRLWILFLRLSLRRTTVPEGRRFRLPRQDGQMHLLRGRSGRNRQFG